MRDLAATSLKGGKSMWSMECVSKSHLWMLDNKEAQVDRGISAWATPGCLQMNYKNMPTGEGQTALNTYKMCIGCYNLLMGSLLMGPMCWVGPCTGKPLPETPFAQLSGQTGSTIDFWTEVILCLVQPISDTFSALFSGWNSAAK
jgi:hypothetical protein